MYTGLFLDRVYGSFAREYMALLRENIWLFKQKIGPILHAISTGLFLGRVYGSFVRECMALLRENIWLFCDRIYGSFNEAYITRDLYRALLHKEPRIRRVYTNIRTHLYSLSRIHAHTQPSPPLSECAHTHTHHARILKSVMCV